MIKLSDYINKNLIKIEIEQKSKKRVIEEIVQFLIEKKIIKKKQEKDLTKAILKREAIGSTGIGQGVALPHAKVSFVKEPLLFFANSKEGVEFNALDGEPVYIIFLLIGPRNDEKGVYIKILSTLAHCVNDPYFRAALIKARTPKEVLEAIVKEERLL
ncbi:MAG: PTS sugar transporter subunit IIA [Elusimicrobia bacterium]|nr:PTS sugar transporter subunit IIA [Elusimicrobiota bacterium]